MASPRPALAAPAPGEAEIAATNASASASASASVETINAARSAAAHRVRTQQNKRAQKEESAAAAVATRAARLQTLALEATQARRARKQTLTRSTTLAGTSKSIKSGSHSSDSLGPLDAQRRINKGLLQKRLEEEEAAQKQRKAQAEKVELARQRAAERVQQKKTKALSASDRDLLQAVSPSPVSVSVPSAAAKLTNVRGSKEPKSSAKAKETAKSESILAEADTVTASLSHSSNRKVGAGLGAVQEHMPWTVGSPWPVSPPHSTDVRAGVGAGSGSGNQRCDWVVAVAAAAATPRAPAPQEQVSGKNNVSATTAPTASTGAPEVLLLGSAESCPGSKEPVEQRLFFTPPSSPSPAQTEARAQTQPAAAVPEEEEDSYVTEAAKNPVFIKVVRAWGLVETLGGCCPYIELNWGTLGRACTATAALTTAPEYACPSMHSCLQFRSPVISNGPSAELLAALEEDTLVAWEDGSTAVPVFLPPLKVTAFSANMSVSDEFIGDGEADAQLLLEQPGCHLVPLFDSLQQPAGMVELLFSFTSDQEAERCKTMR